MHKQTTFIITAESCYPQ